jgi:hypothetical protein
MTLGEKVGYRNAASGFEVFDLPKAGSAGLLAGITHRRRLAGAAARERFRHRSPEALS